MSIMFGEGHRRRELYPSDTPARNRMSFPDAVLLRCRVVSQLWGSASSTARESD